MGKWLGRAAMALAGLCAGLLLLEGAVRWFGPALLEYDGGPEHLYFHTPWKLDAEYRERNACLTPAPAPPAGKRTRLLFVGDSVTERGHIIGALRKRYGQRRFQWLNGGVAAYSTFEVWLLHGVACRKLRPQHVVLTLHNNDFETNRVMYQGRFGRRYIDAMVGVEGWLALHSYLYRLVLGRPGVEGKAPMSAWQWERATANVRFHLIRLRDLVTTDGARLTVVLLPPLRVPPRPEETRSRREALRLLKKLGLRTFDLSAEFQRAVAAGVTLHEAPGDVLHPSQALADRFGAWLFKNGLLSAGSPPGGYRAAPLP